MRVPFAGQGNAPWRVKFWFLKTSRVLKMHLISFYIEQAPSLNTSVSQLECVTFPRVVKCDLEVKQDFSWNRSTRVLMAPKWVANRCSPELPHVFSLSRGRGSRVTNTIQMCTQKSFSAWTKELHHLNQSATVHRMTSHSHSLSEELILPSIKSLQTDHVSRKLF